MKKVDPLFLVTIAFAIAIGLIFTASASGQGRMSEREAIQKSHVDFSREYLYFVIHGQIEIDGHTFVNDTCRHPIIFMATLDGVTIVDTLSKVQYTHRVCTAPGCRVVHLVVKLPPAPTSRTFPSWEYFKQINPGIIYQ